MSERHRPPPPDGPQPGAYPVSSGTVRLLRDLDTEDGWLVLINGVSSSYVDLVDPRHLDFEYMEWIAAVLDCAGATGATGAVADDAPLDVVHVGGGACTLPRYVAATRPGSRQVVFESDPLMLSLAADAFGVRASPVLALHARDGLAGLAGLPAGSADVVIRDAFTGHAVPGPVVPATLRGAGFLAEVARVLRPGGTYVANLVDAPPLAATKAEVTAAARVFDHTGLLTEPAVLRGRRYGNVVVVASTRALPRAALSRRAGGGAVPARLVTGERLAAFVHSRAEDAEDTEGAEDSAAPEGYPGGKIPWPGVRMPRGS